MTLVKHPQSPYINLLLKVSIKPVPDFHCKPVIGHQVEHIYRRKHAEFSQKKKKKERKLTRAPFVYLGSFSVGFTSRTTGISSMLITCNFEMAWKNINDEGEKTLRYNNS